MNLENEETRLELTRVFRAPPEMVFEAWLEREAFQSWIGPEGISCELTLHEPRVGGRYRLVMNLPSGERLPVVGMFKRIEPASCLAFTWTREGSELDSLVTVTLRPHPEGTTLTLTHEGQLITAANREEHVRGWSSTLEKLRRVPTIRGPV